MQMRFRTVLAAVCSLLTLSVAQASDTFTFGTSTNPSGKTFLVDSRGFIIDGRPVIPVMGEMHYARVPRSEWLREIRKMKAGGVTMMATYIFWVHHEENEGEWNWTDNRDLHEFVRLCGQEDMPVVLRVGPFCHGEVYLGGIPQWVVERSQQDSHQYGLRSMAPGFLAEVGRFYQQIGQQVKGLLWKDGGPVVGVQIENECAGPWDYLMALKGLAVQGGLDVPFYTRTGWPNISGKPATFGEMLPLYGDYSDGFWDRSRDDMPGSYREGFQMKSSRLSQVIATETFSKDALTDHGDQQVNSYPYLTCELGGGMTPSYHRRINISGNEMLPLSVVKVGSGSNLPGYYMYHGGTNPYNPQHSMGEFQKSSYTNWNDLPHMSYEFQAPLGEMGRPNPQSFHQSRLFHQFLAQWGGELSRMDVDSMSPHYARRGCFEFYNDYVRILHEEGHAYVLPRGWQIDGMTIDNATVQPFCQTQDGCLYFLQLEGMEPSVTVDGVRYTPRVDHPFRAGSHRLCVLSPERARRAFLIGGRLHYTHHDGILYQADGRIIEEYWRTSKKHVTYTQTSQAGPARQVEVSHAGAAFQPEDSDFSQAAVWQLQLPAGVGEARDLFLEIYYQGDVARVYADGQLVEDNFWNGKPMMVRMSDLIGKRVELRILPMRQDAPIYLQSAQRQILQQANGDLLNLQDIQIIQRFEK